MPKVEIGGGGGGEWWVRRRRSYTCFQRCMVWMEGNGDKKERKKNLKLEMWEDWNTIFCVQRNKMNSLIQTFWIMPRYWMKNEHRHWKYNCYRLISGVINKR